MEGFPLDPIWAPLKEELMDQSHKGQPGEDGLDLCLILLDLPKSRQGLGPGFSAGLHLLNRFPEVLTRAFGCCFWWVRPTPTPLLSLPAEWEGGWFVLWFPRSHYQLGWWRL